MMFKSKNSTPRVAFMTSVTGTFNPEPVTGEPLGRLGRSWEDNAAGRCAGYGSALPEIRESIGGSQGTKLAPC